MASEQPRVPPRPGRSQDPAGGDAVLNAPPIPPRPQRHLERSVSPSREEYTRSPLNELPAPASSSTPGGKLYSQRNLSAQDLPPRPPSVSLPSIGQEGSEYAGFEAEELHRNVSPDLPMHAPRASVPQSTAKSRIQTVTRTDSSQAAAAGIGKPESETQVHPLKAKSSFSRSNLSLSLSLSHEPAAAAAEEQEHGIPEIGVQVPMLKFAGDVQAPTPAPSVQPTPGAGAGSVDAAQRNHHRKRSSRQEFGPPGSYGMHGHRQDPKDQFEKAWYAKHPEELAKEHRPYDPGHARGDWALSSDDLNRLVRESASRGIGMGTSPAAIGTPDEHVGYMASEEYASRMNSPKPRPASLSGAPRRHSSGQQPRVESPLKKEAFSVQEAGHLKAAAGHDDAVESDAERDVIHIDPPAHRASKVGGAGYDPPTQDLGPAGGNTDDKGGWVVEDGYGVPILASDEVAKNTDPAAEYMQPAVSPEQERKGGDYWTAYDSDSSAAHAPSRRRSKETLRTGSGNELARFKSREAGQPSGAGTPLEEIEEYEPLFPDDDDKKPLTAADKLKRPELARHHFPSQDVWEDAPESLQYQTEVSGPQEPEDLSASATFESPEKEQARHRGNAPTDRADFLSDEANKMAKPHFKPAVAGEVRPDLAHRFPSRDVWEDTPDSLQYQTTVSGPQEPEDDDAEGPADVRPPDVPARPARSSKLSELSTPEAAEAPKPQVPARPGAGKPKPQIPARPARVERTASRDGAPLEKVVSPPATKPKPPVPSRPAASSKFAALKAGFLDNLNSRLGQGPVAPPKPEPAAEEAPAQEKAPLADARKGRARGPARRKPAAEPAAAAAAAATSGASSFSIGTTFTVFQITDEGHLSVPNSRLPQALAEGAQEMEKMAAANTSGAAPAEPASARESQESQEAVLSGLPRQAIGHAGDVPEPKLSEATMDRSRAIESEFEAALATSEVQPPSGSTDVASAVPEFTSEVPLDRETDKAEEETPQTADQSVQTGQQDIQINSPTGEHEKMTLVLGGRAPEEGNVVVKEDGEQILGDMDEKHRTEATGHGM